MPSARALQGRANESTPLGKLAGRNFDEGESTMDPFLITLIAVLLGGVALAFYMDWLGLWMSKAEMKEQIARSRDRMQG
jgi:hypothetical protein